MRPFTDNNDKLQALLTDYALATGPRPPCEARIDPDTCVACTAWTTESLEASVRLWGVGRGRGTVTALVEEVLRLRGALETQALAVREFNSVRAERDAWNAEAAEQRERAEKVEAAARAHLAAEDAFSGSCRTTDADVPAACARADAAREGLAGLVGYVGEGRR